METRTCIRDTLLTTTIQVIPEEKSRHRLENLYLGFCSYRYARMLDTETVTNPTERTVAHLLFHRPFDMSVAKHIEGPESLSSSKMETEGKGNSRKCSTRESKRKIYTQVHLL
uniref:Uncharacterized protein n=1 Tax=Brassica oleracea TaxID=3712 RepID=A0A3P6CA62_BRAOL|nr:unnamed protein product [Brassica oleracea]